MRSTVRMAAIFMIVAAPPAAADGDEPPPFAPHLELAARVGAATTVVDHYDTSGGGAGVYVDGEVGWRARRWISIAGFGAFTTLHFDAVLGDCACALNTMYSNASRYLVFDLGARVRFHVGGAFFGLGYGRELARDSTSYACISGCGPSDGSGKETRWYGAPVYELHAGYTFASAEALHGGAVQLIAIASASFAVNASEYDSLSVRGAIGMAF